MKIARGILILFAASFAALTSAHADLNDGSCTNSQTAKVTTQHTATVRGVTLNYSATVGFMEVTASDQTSKACIFYTSYAVQNSTATPRPITFAFNGGPGSASLWLHMGALGPKRVDMGPQGLGGTNPGAVADNPDTILDVSDLVMIDPVATGFSHVEGDAKADAFFGATNDYMSIAAFIQNYLNVNNRWSSPKFVMGESYGGIRGSLLANHLQADLGITLAGLILVSPALSWTTLDFSAADNNTPFWTFFPNFATSAWYHKKTPKYQNLTVDQMYTQAKNFADTTLRNALDQGDDLDATTFNSIAQQVSDFIGVDKDKVSQMDLRVRDVDYFIDLLADQNQTVGRYDARYVGQNTAPLNSTNDIIDPSDNAFSGPFTTAINQYLRVDLQFPLVSPYNTMANIAEWPFNSDGVTFNVLDDLGHALADNPSLRVMIASGYYDLACPMGTVAYEMSQVPGGPSISSRISQTKYEGGHMMYINPSALTALKANIATFIGQQTQAQTPVTTLR